jgi:hypothetical protein
MLAQGTMTGVRAKALALLLVAGVYPAALGAAPAVLPGARSVKVCAAAGPYWPTMTLALNGASAWIACKEQSRLIRVNTRTRKTTKSVRLSGPVIAVASGFGSIWALDSGATLFRLHPTSGKVLRRISLPASAAYNIWIGGGSVWVADDQGAQVLRVSPRTNELVARIPSRGDGPADMAFQGGFAWVVNHRDRVLARISLDTNKSARLSVLGGDNDAPERMVWLARSLWVTGRGTDLLKVRPDDGALERTIEIGASGIDLAAEGDSVWVPTRSAAVDPTGFPTMQDLKRVVASSGTVSTVVRASGRVDVHGIAVRNGTVWLADNTNGRLYQVAGR